MTAQTETLSQLQRYYALWKDCNAMYEEWARAQGLSSNGILILYSFCDRDGTRTQKSISQQWCIPKQTVNTILKDFSAQGYVELSPMPGDRRNKLVRLTPAGQAFAQAVIGKMQRREMYVMERMGPQAIARMNDNLQTFIQLFRQGGTQGNDEN